MSMLTSFDPFFRDFDRVAEGLLGRRNLSPSWMPVDAYRTGDHFVVKFDLPGVDPATVDLTVERNVLSVRAERHWMPEESQQVVLSERPQGTYSRQLYLSDNLDVEHIEASYDYGVLTVTIPVVEKAKPRKLQIATGGKQEAISANSSN
jgi:HSP20 family protein